MKFQKFLSNKFLYLIFILFISLFFTKIYAIEKPTQEFYVNDYANVLSSETKNHIINKSLELYNKDKTQVVVSVVNSLEGLTVEEYALEMFREFGIGDKELNNGILLLLSVGDREVRIEVGYGLEGVINDGKAGRILDNYMIPDLRNNNWDSAVRKGYDAIISELGMSTEGILGLKDNFLYNANDNDSIKIKNVIEVLYIIFTFIFNFIFALVLRKKGKKRIAFIYMIFLFLSSITTSKISDDISMAFFLPLMIFIIAYFRTINSNSRGSYRGGSRNSSRSSSRGGGGSSGGGGASRRF